MLELLRNYLDQHIRIVKIYTMEQSSRGNIFGERFLPSQYRGNNFFQGTCNSWGSLE